MHVAGSVDSTNITTRCKTAILAPLQRSKYNEIPNKKTSCSPSHHPFVAS
uniref:Uncharacterized protein n=1 Tax=Arundo donax TaxID=35708 RepID=A0A0A9EYB6_ARUDO